MSLFEDIKKSAERMTGWHRPKRKRIGRAHQGTQTCTSRFHDDRKIPNNPYRPLVVYRVSAIRDL